MQWCLLRIIDELSYLGIYSPSSLKQHSAGKHVAPPGHIILIPTESVLMMCAEGRSNKYIYLIYNLWFDSSGDRTLDLPPLGLAH